MSKTHKTDTTGGTIRSLNYKGFPVKPRHCHKLSDRNEKYNGWANHRTWEVATAMLNNEGLYDICKHWYLNGYKTFGSLRGKMREYGNEWKVDGITNISWDDDRIRASEITALMNDIFNKPKNIKK